MSKKCNECGTETKTETDKFCHKCGAKITNEIKVKNSNDSSLYNIFVLFVIYALTYQYDRGADLPSSLGSATAPLLLAYVFYRVIYSLIKTRTTSSYRPILFTSLLSILFFVLSIYGGNY